MCLLCEVKGKGRGGQDHGGGRSWDKYMCGVLTSGLEKEACPKVAAVWRVPTTGGVDRGVLDAASPLSV